LFYGVVKSDFKFKSLWGLNMKEISEEENKRIRRHYIFDHKHVQNAYIMTTAQLFSFIILSECNSDDDYVVLMFLHYSKHKRLM
jgi:hypothetical protein